MRRLLGSAAFVAALVACGEPRPAPPPPTPPAAATVKVRRAVLQPVAGGVQVKKASDDAWVDGKGELELGPDDKVRTLRGATAKLVFDNGNTIVLDEGSLVSIAGNGERALVELIEGRLDADVLAGAEDLEVQAAGGRVRAARREITFQ